MREKKFEDSSGEFWLYMLFLILIDGIIIFSVNALPILIFMLICGNENIDKTTIEILITLCSIAVVFAIIMFAGCTPPTKYKTNEEIKLNNNDLFQIYNKIPDIIAKLFSWFIPTNIILGIITRLINKNYLKALLNILLFPLFFFCDYNTIITSEDNTLDIERDTMNSLDHLTAITPKK